MNTNSIFNSINQTGHTNAKSVLRSIRMIYFSMILGVVTFLAVAYYITEDLKFVYDKNDPLIIVTLVMLLSAVPLGFIISKSKWSKIDKSIPLKDRLLQYQPGFIIRIASAEGVGLLSLAGFLISGNQLYLIFAALSLLIFFFYYPSLEKLESELGLSQADLEELQK